MTRLTKDTVSSVVITNQRRGVAKSGDTKGDDSIRIRKVDAGAAKTTEWPDDDFPPITLITPSGDSIGEKLIRKSQHKELLLVLLVATILVWTNWATTLTMQHLVTNKFSSLQLEVKQESELPLSLMTEQTTASKLGRMSTTHDNLQDSMAIKSEISVGTVKGETRHFVDSHGMFEESTPWVSHATNGAHDQTSSHDLDNDQPRSSEEVRTPVTGSSSTSVALSLSRSNPLVASTLHLLNMEGDAAMQLRISVAKSPTILNQMAVSTFEGGLLSVDWGDVNIANDQTSSHDLNKDRRRSVEKVRAHDALPKSPISVALSLSISNHLVDSTPQRTKMEEDAAQQLLISMASSSSIFNSVAKSEFEGRLVLVDREESPSLRMLRSSSLDHPIVTYSPMGELAVVEKDNAPPEVVRPLSSWSLRQGLCNIQFHNMAICSESAGGSSICLNQMDILTPREGLPDIEFDVAPLFSEVDHIATPTPKGKLRDREAENAGNLSFRSNANAVHQDMECDAPLLDSEVETSLSVTNCLAASILQGECAEIGSNNKARPPPLLSLSAATAFQPDNIVGRLHDSSPQPKSRWEGVPMCPDTSSRLNIMDGFVLGESTRPLRKTVQNVNDKIAHVIPIDFYDSDVHKSPMLLMQRDNERTEWFRMALHGLLSLLRRGLISSLSKKRMTIIEMVSSPWGTFPPGISQLSTMKHLEFPKQQVVPLSSERSTRRDRSPMERHSASHESIVFLPNTPWGTIPSWLGESSTLRLWNHVEFNGFELDRLNLAKERTMTTTTERQRQNQPRRPGDILKEHASNIDTKRAWMQNLLIQNSFTGTISRSQLATMGLNLNP
jgi:hypothetical protein